MEHAPLQQASGKLHEEARAGRKEILSLKISQEVEIVPGCAVTMSYLPSPLLLLLCNLGQAGMLGT